MLDPKNSSKMPNFLKEPNLKAKNSCFCGEYYTTLPNTLGMSIVYGRCFLLCGFILNVSKTSLNVNRVEDVAEVFDNGNFDS